MKKIMTFIVLVGLLVLGATSVLASAIYFDYMPSGTVEGSNSKGSSSPDCSDYQVGVVVPVEKFQFGLEYSSTDIDDDTSMQLTGWKIMGGYQCFKTDQFELFTNLSYLYWKAEAEGSTVIRYSPLLIGIACKYRMNDQMFINGSVDCATSDFVIREDESEAYPADYASARVKYSYFFTKGFAASLGYNWSKFKWDHSIAGCNELVTKGFTIGASYNF